jgi:hypothetical protein
MNSKMRNLKITAHTADGFTFVEDDSFEKEDEKDEMNFLETFNIGDVYSLTYVSDLKPGSKQLKSSIKTLEIDWNLINEIKCKYLYNFPEEEELNVDRYDATVSVSLGIMYAPKQIPVLSPFEVSLVLNNRTKVDNAFQLTIHNIEHQFLVPYGVSYYETPIIRGNETYTFKTNFIGLKEGFFLFQSIEFLGLGKVNFQMGVFVKKAETEITD